MGFSPPFGLEVATPFDFVPKIIVSMERIHQRLSFSREVLIKSQSKTDSVMGQVFVKRMKAARSRSSAPVSKPSAKAVRAG